MPRPSSTTLAVELTPQAVTARIVTLRGVQVLFDRDLAQFFEVQPIRLREQVKRNLARFPADFMFQLTSEEVAAMVSQNAIPSKQQLGGYLPYAFTEEGVAALTAVLRSPRAIDVGIQIVRAFVSMRKFMRFYNKDVELSTQKTHEQAILKSVTALLSCVPL